MYAVKLPKTVPNYSDGNIWEESGYFEGDMVIDKHNIRNGLIDKSKQWPYGEVSYKVRESDFCKYEHKTSTNLSHVLRPFLERVITTQSYNTSSLR